MYWSFSCIRHCPTGLLFVICLLVYTWTHPVLYSCIISMLRYPCYKLSAALIYYNGNDISFFIMLVFIFISLCSFQYKLSTTNGFLFSTNHLYSCYKKYYRFWWQHSSQRCRHLLAGGYLLLTPFNCNLSMDKFVYIVYIPSKVWHEITYGFQFQWFNHWSLGMVKFFQPTLYDGRK